MPQEQLTYLIAGLALFGITARVYVNFFMKKRWKIDKKIEFKERI